MVQLKKKWSKQNVVVAAEHDLLYILCNAKDSYALLKSISLMQFQLSQIWMLRSFDSWLD